MSSGVPQRSLLGQLLSLIFIDDFRDNISLISDVFAGDISLFSKVLYHKQCFKKLKRNLDAADLWNEQFNQDRGKQVIKVYF